MTREREALDFLCRWLGLSAAQQRALEALVREIQSVSTYVETNTQQVSERFQDMAATTREQASTIRELLTSAQTIEVGHQVVSLETMAGSLGEALSELIEKIILLSSRGVAMVYSLDDVLAELKAVRESVKQID